MGEFFPWAAGITLAIGFSLTLLFSCNYKAKGIGEGILFGSYAGLLIGLLQAGIYPYLAIPLSLGAVWFIGGLLQWMVAGITIFAVYRN